ncbi:MAG: biopolymer transporter ExbD [Geminicoccaceae bacterium]
MQRRSSSPARRRRRSVALTPLIDVVFILLIFFVMAGRFTQDGRIVLARSADPANADTDNSPDGETPPRILVFVEADGSLAVGGSPVDAAMLADRVDSNATLVLHLSPDLAVGPMVRAIDSLREEGLEQLTYLPAAEG